MPEQHPIPQQISSYSFKLVGDMTLKQFSQLAGGALISLLFYASPLHSLIKWPLIILSFMFGVALAFLPIEDRALSTWIVIFFRSIYSPTYFVWRKGGIKDFFALEEGAAGAPAVVIAEKKEERAELLEPVIKTTPSVEKLEEKEKSFLSKMTQNFIAPGTTVVITATPLHTYRPGQPVRGGAAINVPQTKSTTVIHKGLSEPEALQSRWQKTQEEPKMETTPPSFTPMATTSFTATKMAQFSQDEMPPIPPTRANNIVGQVLAPDGKIIEGAILEIRDSEGRPVRALKTNRLGHFSIATPLLDGRYEIITEKDGFEFDQVYFDAQDKIIPPVAIWAKSGSTEINQFKT
ncbi:hypothetical protein A3E41_02010 [Candidatus Woesebacteria bacterium RIFCSPHIGHO2_12_FULL_38_9]|nr:MAG: hypothetical protein A3E41_02010 [Candidatus Woesebacteria bacterium RIFCSPHIGHO2_12_FULL_38_9]